MDLLVVAKEPTPGCVKTRLCPPCSPAEAASIAEAALSDTLEHALASSADRVVLALDGVAGAWCPPAIEVVDQGPGSFAMRLARAWSGVSGPGFQIGMDTPQVAEDDLDAAMRVLAEPGVDAVLGPASDGGWWGLGLRKVPDDPTQIFAGIAMSCSQTGAHQLQRLEAHGLRVRVLATRTDVDTWSDARAVAVAAPATRFAAAVRTVEERLS